MATAVDPEEMTSAVHVGHLADATTQTADLPDLQDQQEMRVLVSASSSSTQQSTSLPPIILMGGEMVALTLHVGVRDAAPPHATSTAGPRPDAPPDE